MTWGGGGGKGREGLRDGHTKDKDESSSIVGEGQFGCANNRAHSSVHTGSLSCLSEGTCLRTRKVEKGPQGRRSEDGCPVGKHISLA